MGIEIPVSTTVIGLSELSLLSSGTAGDLAHFFEGDVLHEGAGDGCKSLTRTCVIHSLIGFEWL